MKILFLGSSNKIKTYLIEKGNQVIVSSSIITLDNNLKKFDYIISFKYRYIISKDIVNYFKNRIFNLHISYLPWNRGAYPNLWSFLDNTKKGITIHQVSNKLDAGPILFQREISYFEDDTLFTSYNRLNKSIEEMFINNWEKIHTKNYELFISKENGSYNNLQKFSSVNHLLKDGWNTKVMDILGMGNKL